ncbi:MAG: hypothetical protein ACREGJ_00610 [Candidatus Saccharimonadales bacterium]
MRSKRSIIVLLVAVLAVLVLGAAWLWWPRGAESEPPKAASSPTSSLDYRQDLQDLEKILNKPGSSLEEQSLAFASFLRESYVKAGQPALPGGITIAFQPETFKLQDGDDSKATVDAKLSNGQVHIVYLAKENSHWYILTTVAR